MAELDNMGGSGDPNERGLHLQAPDAATDPSLSSMSYRPVSVLAVIGFGASVLYAAIMVVMALFAFLQGRSMFWPLATLLIPVFTTTLSAIGYFAVQRSEGTRAGGKLAQYGLILSIGIALLYLAYYAGVFFAVRSQALDCADKFFADLQNADVDQAFRLSLPPDQRPASEKGSALHTALEREHNIPSETAPKGPYNQFTQDPLVFFMAEGGKDTKIESLGTTFPEYAQGGYVMKANYRITTPEGWSYAQLTLASTEGGKSGKGKREWRVSDFKMPQKDFIRSPLGVAVQEVHEKSAAPFARRWLENLRKNPSEAAIDSVPQAEREDLAGRWLLVAFAGTANDSPCALLAGNGLLHTAMLQEERLNSLYGLDDERLFPEGIEAPETRRSRQILLMGCRHFLLHGRDAIQVGTERTTYRWHRLGEQDRVLRIEQDLEFSVMMPMLAGPMPPDRKPPPMSVQATLILEGNASALENSEEDPNWRVVQLLVTRARLAAPQAQQQPGRPK